MKHTVKDYHISIKERKNILYEDNAVNSTHNGEKATYEMDGKSYKTLKFNSDADANVYLSQKPKWGILGKQGKEVHVCKKKKMPKDTTTTKQSDSGVVKESLEARLVKINESAKDIAPKTNTTHDGETRDVFTHEDRTYQTYSFNSESEANNFLNHNKGFGIIGRNGYKIHVCKKVAKGRPLNTVKTKQSIDGTTDAGSTHQEKLKNKVKMNEAKTTVPTASGTGNVSFSTAGKNLVVVAIEGKKHGVVFNKSIYKALVSFANENGLKW